MPAIKPEKVKRYLYKITKFTNPKDISDRPLHETTVNREEKDIKEFEVHFQSKHRGCLGDLKVDYNSSPKTCSKCALEVNYRAADISKFQFVKHVSIVDVSSVSVPPEKLYYKSENGRTFLTARKMTEDEIFNYYYPDLKAEKITVEDAKSILNSSQISALDSNR